MLMDPDTSSERSLEKEISRRRMLKRVGAGAAIAWTAPILTSVHSPAFAQYPGCAAPCAACFDSSAAAGAVPKHPIIFSKVPETVIPPSAEVVIDP